MKKLISLLLAVCVLIGCAGVLSGCGAPKDSGAEILVYLSDIVYDLDPTDYVVDDNEMQLLSLLYEPLFKLGKNGKLQMAAAKNYKVNRKERTITIRLRESYWSDGRAVQAQDFIFAWRDRIIDPSRANPAAALFYDIENAVDIKNGTNTDLYSFGAKALDIHTIEITYREGADVNQLLKNLASVVTAPVREDAVRRAPDSWSKLIDNIVSNGPFSLKTYTLEQDEADATKIANAEFTLTRNIGYHQNPETVNYTKQVTPDSLVTFWAGDNAVELTYSEIENKTLFFMGEATAEVREQYKKKATVTDMLSTYCYAFNTTNPLFANEHVRRALSLALDRTAMQNAVVFGTAAQGFYPGTEGLISTSANPSAAQEELSQAGTLTNKAFTLTVNNDPDSVTLAEMAKAAWEDLGFEVTVKPVDFKKTKVVLDIANNDEIEIKDSIVQSTVKDASVDVYDYDVIAVDWQMYSADKFVALCAFTSDMNGCGHDPRLGTIHASITGWTSDEYDALVKQAYDTTADKKARAAALDDAERALVEAAPIVPVLYNQNYAFIGSQLKGVKTDGFGFFIFTKANLKNYHEYTVESIIEKDDESVE